MTAVERLPWGCGPGFRVKPTSIENEPRRFGSFREWWVRLGRRSSANTSLDVSLASREESEREIRRPRDRSQIRFGG